LEVVYANETQMQIQQYAAALWFCQLRLLLKISA